MPDAYSRVDYAGRSLDERTPRARFKYLFSGSRSAGGEQARPASKGAGRIVDALPLRYMRALA